MQHLHLRPTHNYHAAIGLLSEEMPSLGIRMCFLLPGLIFAMITGIIYTKKCQQINHRFLVYTTPKKEVTAVLYPLAMVAHFATGFYALVENSWFMKSWFYFAAISVLVGAYNCIYQFGRPYTVLFVVVVIGMTIIAKQVLFFMSIEHTSVLADMLIRNIVGVGFSLSITIFCYHIGQVLVYVVGFTRKCQALIYWIAVPSLMVVVVTTVYHVHGSFRGMVGFIAASVPQLLGVGLSTIHHWKEDIFEDQ